MLQIQSNTNHLDSGNIRGYLRRRNRLSLATTRIGAVDARRRDSASVCSTVQDDLDISVYRPIQDTRFSVRQASRTHASLSKGFRRTLWRANSSFHKILVAYHFFLGVEAYTTRQDCDGKAGDGRNVGDKRRTLGDIIDEFH